MLGLFAALLVTVLVLLLAVRGLRAIQAGAAAGPLPLHVLQRVAAGPKHAIAVVRAGDRVLLVGLGEAGVQLLAELDGTDLAAALAPPDVGTAPPPPGWRLLRRLAGLGAVALVAGLAYGHPAALTAQAIQAPTPGRAGVETPAPPTVQLALGQGGDALRLEGTVGLVVFLGALTLLPALVMLMTSFTRIVIVLHFLRSALGTPTTPPTQLLVALAILLSGLVMQPVLAEVHQQALQPYLGGELSQVQAYQAAVVPLRRFMLANTRDEDLGSFVDLAGAQDAATLDDVSTVTIVSAFVTSELRTAFQMGFVLFLPFIVVDLIVASILMSMGMFMLPPQMVSLPFKLLLFVLADGWTLVVRNLVASFQG